MTIGIDLDDTFVDTTNCFLEIMKGIPEYNTITNFYEMEPEKIEDFMKNYFVNYVGNLKLKKDALEVLKYFKSKNIKILFITARGSQGYDSLLELTDKFLEDSGVCYDKIIYKQTYKGNACIENNVDVFIDDMEYVLDEVKEKEVKTLRFSENDVNSKHEIVHSWLEIKEFIDSIGGV